EPRTVPLKLKPLRPRARTGRRHLRSTRVPWAAFGSLAVSGEFQAGLPVTDVSLRVVLYAEGAGETGGELSLPPTPGSELAADHPGPGHELVRRCIVHSSPLKEGAVIFVAPLRLKTGRIPKGSDLLHRASLRQLLQWARPEHRPRFAIILVDCDGNNGRKQ